MTFPGEDGMRRLAQEWGLLGVLLLGVLPLGCSRDDHARRLLKWDTSWGTMDQALLGTGREMQGIGRIDAYPRIETSDGTVIDCWVIRSRSSHQQPEQASRGEPGTVILFHGLTRSKSQNFALGQTLADRGFDVVLPDHRAHGRSTGDYTTWGAIESRDAVEVVDRLLAEGQIREPIYAWGVSMGGATAILYAAQDERCRGVMAVAPYSDPRIVTRGLYGLQTDEEFTDIWTRAGEMGGFRPEEACPVRVVDRIRGPVILVHGQLDTMVPISNSREIYQAAGEPRELNELPGISHATILLGRDQWFAEKMQELVLRSRAERETAPQTPAGNPDPPAPSAVGMPTGSR